jgi:uncharacterized protein
MRLSAKLLVIFVPLVARACLAQTRTPGHDPAKIQVLLITGYNSTPMHHWRTIDAALRDILESSGKFEVRIDEEPHGATAETFSPYDVLLLDYSDYTTSMALTWPESTRRAYLDFLKSGKGIVAFHVTVGSFPEWPEFRATLGILDYKRIGHGPYHTFTVKIVDRNSELAKGLPRHFDEWGEIYDGLKLQDDVHVLATAFDDSGNCAPSGGPCGSGEDEPIIWTVHYGRGRVFVDTLGHDSESISTASFKALLNRGTEWAAKDPITGR